MPVERRIEARATVEHVQPHAVARRLGDQLDRSVPVTQSVVDQVGERLLRAQAVGVDGDPVRVRHAQLAARLGRSDVEPPGCRSKKLGGVEPLGADRQAALVSARQHEEVLGEPLEPVALLDRRGERGAQLLG